MLTANLSLTSVTGAANSGGGGGGGYTGPLDIVPGAVVAYGQRALSAAKLGSALYTIRRDSDDTTQSFNSDALTGAAPVADINSFLSGGNGFGTVLNDQSGNARDASQATAINQPLWVASATNNIPAFALLPSGTFFGTPSFALNGAAYTIIAVFGQYAADAPLSLRAGMNGNDDSDANGPDFSLGFIFASGGFSGAFFFGTDGTGFSDGNGANYTNPSPSTAYYLVDCRANLLTAPSTFFNGATVPVNSFAYGTGDPGIITFPLGVGVVDPTSPSGNSDCNLLELIIYQTALSDADMTAIRQNIAAFYGITLS